ncbi:hypothetical protein U6A24_22440 [Aquimarina gracilis]|uniref:DUF1330 domain-containing protein n=1 Tax=Aquimarina gracilis TaxID=874422 RepID=A0ABU6A287_9FLAO|nr:hypothetical protein [Aquimarina gracilis]MEB3348254.1 hypothetical protein [Aquimarina gracilis]
MSTKYIGVTTEQFQTFSQLPVEGPFQMLNLLKFKDKVEETGTTGAEAYAQYMKAVIPFFQASKAKVVYQGKPQFTLIGPEDEKEWDKILIIEYASKEDFIKMITAEGYPAKMRSQALEDSRLILSIAQ